MLKNVQTKLNSTETKHLKKNNVLLSAAIDIKITSSCLFVCGLFFSYKLTAFTSSIAYYPGIGYYSNSFSPSQLLVFLTLSDSLDLVVGFLLCDALKDV